MDFVIIETVTIFFYFIIRRSSLSEFSSQGNTRYRCMHGNSAAFVGKLSLIWSVSKHWELKKTSCFLLVTTTNLSSVQECSVIQSYSVHIGGNRGLCLLTSNLQCLLRHRDRALKYIYIFSQTFYKYTLIFQNLGNFLFSHALTLYVCLSLWPFHGAFIISQV